MTVVIFDGFVKLVLSNIEKSNIHLFPIFGEDFVERDSSKLPRIVGGDTILNLLTPEGVDLVVRRS